MHKDSRFEVQGSKFKNYEYSLDSNAYIDNELDDENNIKIKKLTINNKKARRYLEDSYALRQVISNSFEKEKNDMRYDFSKKVLLALDFDEKDYTLNPFIKWTAVIFTMVLFGTIFTAVILNVGW